MDIIFTGLCLFIWFLITFLVQFTKQWSLNPVSVTTDWKFFSESDISIRSIVEEEFLLVFVYYSD